MPRKSNRNTRRRSRNKVVVVPDVGTVKLDTSMSSKVRIRFSASSGFSSQQINLSNLADMIFINSTPTSGVAQARMFSAIRLNSVTIVQAPQGSGVATGVDAANCSFTWANQASSNTSGANSFVMSAKPTLWQINAQGSLPAKAVFRPPKRSIQSQWLNTATGGYTTPAYSDIALFTIGMSTFATIEIDMSVVITPALNGNNYPPTQGVYNGSGLPASPGGIFCSGLIRGGFATYLQPYGWQFIRLN